MTTNAASTGRLHGISARCRAFAIAAILSLSMLGGVGCDETPVEAPAEPVTIPGVGSRFIYQVQYRTGGYESFRFDTMTVVRSGLRFAGERNVVEFRVDDGSAFERYRYFSYSNDSEIREARSRHEIYSPLDGSDGIAWVRLPLGGNQSVLSVADVAEDAGSSIRYFYDAIREQKEVMEVDGQSVSSIRFQIITSLKNNNPISTDLRWIAPSLGIPSRMEYTESSTEYECQLVSIVIR